MQIKTALLLYYVRIVCLHNKGLSILHVIVSHESKPNIIHISAIVYWRGANAKKLNLFKNLVFFGIFEMMQTSLQNFCSFVAIF